MTLNTRLSYLYHDAGNNTAFGGIVFTGMATPARYRRLLDSLPVDQAGHRWFVPEQIGLPSLRHLMPGTAQHDSNWHEITGAEPASDSPSSNEPFECFITRCLMVSRWDPDPRIAHGTIILDGVHHHAVHPCHPCQACQASQGSQGRVETAAVPAADCWLPWGADTWIAARLGSPDDDLPAPPVRPIDDIPPAGRLLYRVRAQPAARELIDVTLAARGVMTAAPAAAQTCATHLTVGPVCRG